MQHLLELWKQSLYRKFCVLIAGHVVYYKRGNQSHNSKRVQDDPNSLIDKVKTHLTQHKDSEHIHGLLKNLESLYSYAFFSEHA